MFCAARIGAAYIRATHTYVRIGFFQEGLGDGERFQVATNCQVKAITEPPVEGIIPLGWLERGTIVTIQVHVTRNVSPFLEYWFYVNGRPLPKYHTPGKPGTPKGIGGAQFVRKHGWLMERSFTTFGVPLVRAGCKSATSLELSGTAAGLSEDEESKIFDTVIQAATISRWITFGVGLALLFGGLITQAFDAWSSSRVGKSLLLVFFTLVLALGSAKLTLEFPEATKVLADLASVAIALVGAWWLRFQIATVAGHIRSFALRAGTDDSA
jgi:hypothetical protein